MRPKAQKKIAHYRTPGGAENYAKALRFAWPLYRFEVVNHLHDFGYAVIVDFSSKAYVLACPRKDIGKLFSGN